MPTTTELRHAGLAACRQYRALLGDATDLYLQCKNRGDKPHARYWLASALDWHRRLTHEQLLLVALRYGGERAWRSQVTEAGCIETPTVLWPTRERLN